MQALSHAKIMPHKYNAGIFEEILGVYIFRNMLYNF